MPADDFDSDPLYTEGRGGSSTASYFKRTNRGLTAIIIVALVLIAAGLVGWYVNSRNAAPPQAAGAPPATQEASAPTTLELPEAEQADAGPQSDDAINASIDEPAPPLPPLAQSDDFVRDQLQGWTIPHVFLQEDDLLARLAVVILNAGTGSVPRRLLKASVPTEPFQVYTSDGRIYLDSASYTRYDRHASVLESIDPAKAAAFLTLVDPLLKEALGQLGESKPPKGLVNDALQRIDNLPTLPNRVELVADEAMYVYADGALEALPEFEKQMLRLGPNNITRVKNWLSRFAAAYAP